MSHTNNNNIAGTLTGDLGAHPTTQTTGTRDSHGVHHSGAGMTAHAPQTGTSATRDAQSFGSAGVPPAVGTGIASSHGNHSHGHGLLSGLETAGAGMGASSAAQTHHTGAIGQPHAGAGGVGASGLTAPGHGLHSGSGSHGTSHVGSGLASGGSHAGTGLASAGAVGGASALSSTGSSGLAPPLDDTYGTKGRFVDPSSTTGTSSHGGIASNLSHADHSSHGHSHGDHSAHSHGAAVPAVASAAAVDHSSHTHNTDDSSHGHKSQVIGAPGVTGYGDGHGKQSIGGPVHPEAAVGSAGAHDGGLGSSPAVGHHKPTIGDKISGGIDKLVGGVTKNEEKKAVGAAKLAGSDLPGVEAGVAGVGNIQTGRSGSSGTHHAH